MMSNNNNETLPNYNNDYNGVQEMTKHIVALAAMVPISHDIRSRK